MKRSQFPLRISAVALFIFLFTSASAQHSNVTISTGTQTGGSFTGTAPNRTFTLSADNAVLNITNLLTELTTSNVTISTSRAAGTQNGDITVSNDITSATASGGTQRTLTLTAGRNIVLNAVLNLSGSNGASGNPGTPGGPGKNLVLTAGSGGTVSITTGAITTTGGTGGSGSNQNRNSGAGGTSGSITITGPSGVVITQALTTTGGTGGTTAGAGSGTGGNGGAAGNISITAAGGIRFSANLTANAGAAGTGGGGGGTAGAAGALSISDDNATITSGGGVNDGQTAGTISGGSFTKLGSGVLVLGGTKSWTGSTTISAGVLVEATSAIPTGNLVLNGGVLGLGFQNFSLGLGTGTSQVQFTGAANSGFAAYSAARTVNIGGAGATLTWNSTANFLTTGTLVLGASSADNEVNFQNAINLNGATRTVQVDNGSSMDDAELSGVISSTGGLLSKTGAGTLALSGNNTYTGGTNLTAGCICVNSTTALGTGTLTISASTTLDNTSGGTITNANNNAQSWNGDFTFTGSNALNLGTGTVTLGASRQVTVSASTLTVGGTINHNTLTLTKAGAGSLGFGSQAVTLSGLTISAGTLVSTTGTLAIAGTLSNSGTFTHNSGTVDFNATGAQSIPALNFNNLTISGNRSSNAVTLANSGTIGVAGTFSVTATNATYTTTGSTISFIGSALQSVPVFSYNNLTVNNSAGAGIAGSLTVAGTLTLTSGKLAIGANLLTLNGAVASMSATNSLTGSANSELTISGSGAFGTVYFDDASDRTSNAIKHLTINRSGQTVILGNTLYLKGVMNPAAGTLNTGGFLVVASEATGTARILNASSFTFSGNVTAERYIPAKTQRRYTFIASPIHGVTIRSSWQNDIFITGKGNGGQVCGVGTGNGGGTDRYNDNGFDATTSNTPSMYTYNQDLAARWDSVLTTTSTNLTKGIGYRLLVRGPRGASDANCTDQLNSVGAAGPAEATLSATGPLTTGNVTATIQAKTTGTFGYTLLGNPYACEINFDQFYTSNSILLTGRKYWTYDPWSNSTAYLTYVNGTVAGNFGGNIVDSNGNRIASGGAFFVETSNSVDQTASFTEAMKLDANQKGAFRTTSVVRKIRVKFKKSNDTQVDDIVIRFSDEAGVSVNETESLDARTMNASNFLASIKGTRSFAISTRPISFYNDTVMVRVVSSSTGDFKLTFHDFQDFTEAAEIILLDLYTGTQTDVKANPLYNFSISGDAATQGGRFKLVFRSQTSVLPVTFTTITATTKEPGVEVEWRVASEQNIANYVVERSENGRDFHSVGTVPSKGNSSFEVVYNFMDSRPLSGVAYYRVKSVDVAGASKYTAVVKVNATKQGSMLTMYPNPVKDQLNLVVSNSATFGKASCVITNIQGKTIQLTYIQGTNGNYKADVSSLAPGMYFITLTNNNGERLMEKFIKF